MNPIEKALIARNFCKTLVLRATLIAMVAYVPVDAFVVVKTTIIMMGSFAHITAVL